MNRFIILLLGVSVILCGCVGTRRNLSETHAISITSRGDAAIKRLPPETKDDVTAIKKLFTENATALSAGNVSALARFYEENAIQLPPNSAALIGWDAIRSTLEKELSGIKVAATIEVLEVCASDSWAFARGTYRMVTTPQGGGEKEVTKGNWLDILKRQTDGSWKIARSTWTSEEL